MAKTHCRFVNRTTTPITTDNTYLTFYLRYGSTNPRDKSKIWHSKAWIAKELCLTNKQVNCILLEDLALVIRQAVVKRKRPVWFPLCTEEKNFLTKKENLARHFQYSLGDRVKLFNKKFGKGRINLYRLKKLYEKEGILLRKITTSVSLTASQLEAQKEKKLEVLPFVLTLC